MSQGNRESTSPYWLRPCAQRRFRHITSHRQRRTDMIRRAFDSDMLASDPTPDEILLRTEEIRRTWTPRERTRRLGIKRASWMPPVFSEHDVPGIANAD